MKNEVEAILNNEGVNVQGMSLDKVKVRNTARLVLVTREGMKEFVITHALLNFMKGQKSIYFGSTGKRGKKVGVILTWEK